MDLSYNDPNYVPMYSLDGIGDVIVAVWSLSTVINCAQLRKWLQPNSPLGEMDSDEESNWSDDNTVFTVSITI